MDRDAAEEIKRHLNVVSEGFRSDIRTVAEGLQGFRKEVAAEFKNVREEIAEVKAMIRLATPSVLGRLDCSRRLLS